jgi:hypothetical protein
LRKQLEFLRDEVAQPPLASTRPTTSYHHPTQIKTTPDPAFYACPQQEATQLGISPEQLVVISKEAICEQAKCLTSDKANQKKGESERWQSERRADRRGDK